MNLTKTQQGVIARAAIMAATHIRILAMPMEAIVLWQRLVLAIVEFGTDGVLRLGDGQDYSRAALAQFRLHVGETQFETYLETWARNLTITYDAASGAIALPAELMPSRRALASRLNGKKGGRPPKNSNLTPQNDPRQRTAMMPIAGGKAVSDTLPAETQTKPDASPARDKLSLACTNSFEEKAKLEAREVSKEEIDGLFHELGPKVFEAAGFDPTKDTCNWGYVRQWVADALKSGFTADETRRTVLHVVATIAERERAKGNPPHHLGYFGKAMAKAIATRDIPAPVLTPDEREAEREWERDMQAWSAKASRPGDAGPAPKLEDYLAARRAA